MANYTWSAIAGSGDWATAAAWRPSSGPPGGSSSGIDDAVLGAAGASYAVTIGSADIFDINTLDITGASSGDTTSLDIGGALFVNQLAFGGPGGDAPITITSDGLLLVRTNLTATAAETITIAGGEIELGSSIFDGINLGTANVTFAFADGGADAKGGIFEINSSHFRIGETARQTVTNFAHGDVIQFDGADFTGDTYTYVGTTLTVLNGSTTVLTMSHLSTAPDIHFHFSGELIEAAVCFAAGTHILTVTGEQTVERLRKGDMVRVLSGGELCTQRVKWVGRRRIDLTAHPRPETVAPIRILRDAVADGVPHHDLLVSPDHAIFVDRKLICARQLVNGTTIRQELGWTAVEYFHVELESHAILFAEGLPAESYLDTGNRSFFSNSGEYLVLHPDLATEADRPTREAASCEQFVWHAAGVQPVWQHLAIRAAELGHSAIAGVTCDPELHIIAAVRSFRPVACESGRYVFLLPPGVTEARIRSRAGPPDTVRRWMTDHRCLGVDVARIVLRGVSDVIEVPMDDPGLSRGWWAVERDSGMLRRWTDGDAVLPLPALTGPAILEIHLGGNDLAYAVATSRAA